MLWNGYRSLLLADAWPASRRLAGWSCGISRSYPGNVDAWRTRTILLVWPIVVCCCS